MCGVYYKISDMKFWESLSSCALHSTAAEHQETVRIHAVVEKCVPLTRIVCMTWIRKRIACMARIRKPVTS
jgi:hypothetical protein